MQWLNQILSVITFQKSFFFIFSFLPWTCNISLTQLENSQRSLYYSYNAANIIYTNFPIWVKESREPGLVDRVLALHAGSRGHMSELFFRSNRPGYPHPVSSELENSSIRVAVSDCRVSERQRWHSPYQTGKTVHVHAKHYKHEDDARHRMCAAMVPYRWATRGTSLRELEYTHTHTIWVYCI